MKKALLIFLILPFVLCGCAETDPNAKELKAVLQQYKTYVKEAASSDTLTHILLDRDIIIDDKDMIDRWIAALQKLELEPQVYNESKHVLYGDYSYSITFCYPDKTVKLGAFFTSQINIQYGVDDGPPKYVLEIANKEAGAQLRQLAKECGHPDRLI